MEELPHLFIGCFPFHLIYIPMSTRSLLLVGAWFVSAFSVHAQSFSADAKIPNNVVNFAFLPGRWEVVSYSEQGVYVEKKQDPIPQAVKVYQQVKAERAKRYYGFDAETDELSRRASRAFKRWEVEDSTQEVKRVIKAIQTPFVAVFFQDGTLSLYNKDENGQITNVRDHQYSLTLNSLRMEPGPMYRPKWFVQILSLSEDQMRLFLPEEATIVDLVKTPFILP